MVFFLANWGKTPKNIIALLLAENLAKISPTLHPCVVLRGLSLLANFFL
jgi:hypothetical protein